MIADRYSLDRVVGRGGMGAVWLAQDELLGREVALKRIGLLPGATSTDIARAEREARLAAALDHPHVVAVFNLVVDGDERWLVMEYVDGSTLADLVRQRGPLTPDAAAPLLAQAADALAAAHAAGIVHRDVKPSNILVARDGQVKLTDFGIARVSADPSLTQTGLVTGSPAYLAPEVAAGGSATPASDVWALGATLFHVLSGRPPYEIGDHVLGGLYRIVNEEPPRLDHAGWLAPLLEATMAKDPAQRWSAAQVRAYLAAPEAAPAAAWPAAAAPPGDPTSTRQLRTTPSPAARGGRPAPARQRALLAGLVGVAVLVTLGLGLLTLLPDGQTTADEAGGTPSSTASDPPETPTTPEAEGSPAAAEQPTAAGMESFIRDYVAAVGSDPRAAWPMLTPKFQAESGGLDDYREFWDDVGRGEVLDVSADPQSLVVSYRVRFENFGTGRRPTVLQLAYQDGRYLIDGESTEGFVPAT